jgi:hypothetical protein
MTKLAKLKEEIEILDVLSEASPALQAARAEVTRLENARASDPDVLYNEQLIKSLKQQLAQLETSIEVAERALAAAERAHESRLIDAVQLADGLEKVDAEKNKEASTYAMQLTQAYKMPISELRALVD